MMNQKISKNEIRKKAIFRRNQYNIDFLHKFNSRVKKNIFILFNNLFSRFEKKENINIFTYLSMFERGEVDTWGIIEFLQNNLGINSIYVPKIIGKEMTEAKFTNRFYKNQYGIFECEQSQNPFSDNFDNEHPIPDIVIVPLLAFSKDGHRVGYGGGYYDKYLRDRLKKNKNIITIGLSFENHSLDNWVVDPFDIPMDYVVTATKIYEF